LKNPLNKQLSFRKDLILTIINGFIVLFGIFLLNGYIARIFGIEYLGEYLLVRRIVFSLVAILLFGMNISLPTLIARKIANIGDIGFLIFLTFSLPLALIISILMQYDIISDFPQLSYLSYFLFITGISLQFLTYGLYRGHLNMIGANLIQFVSTALIPIGIFLFKFSLEKSLMWIGVLLIIFNLANYLKRNDLIRIPSNRKIVAKNILNFGYVRYASFVSQFLLLALIPILISRSGNYSDVAYFTSSMAVLRSLLVVVGPLGIILLPRISYAISQGKQLKIKNGLEVLIEIVMIFSLIIATSLSLFGGNILNLWLGDISKNGIWIIKTIMIFLPFYIFADIFRSPIDALSVKGYNSIVYSISAGTLIISYFTLFLLGFNEIISGVYSFGIGYITASIISYIIINKKLNIILPRPRFLLLCLFSILLLIFSYKLLISTIESYFTVVALYGIVFIFISLFIFKLNYSNWKLRVSN